MTASLSANSSAGPSSATSPTSSTTARSASDNASAAFCSTSTTVTPRSLISRMTAPTRSTIFGASPSDGSSSRSTLGEAISARPMASICCSPPLSSPARCVARSRRIGNSPSTQARACARAALSGAASAPARRFSSTVRLLNTRRPSGTWTSPPRAIDAASSAGSGWSRKRMLPPVIAPPWAASVPESARSSVDLPAPLLPSTARTAPSGTESETPRSAFTAPA